MNNDGLAPFEPALSYRNITPAGGTLLERTIAFNFDCSVAGRPLGQLDSACAVMTPQHRPYRGSFPSNMPLCGLHQGIFLLPIARVTRSHVAHLLAER